MKLTIVGSGTAAPTPERVCSGYFVEAGDDRLLLDCGAGVVHGMARLGLPWDALDHLLITHFHNDHIGDLPMLLFALEHGVRPKREKPLSIWAPHGIGERLRAMEAAFGAHVADPGFPVAIREVVPGDEFEVGPLAVRAVSTPHTEESLAYRLEAEDGILGYTGDTGPSAEVARVLAGVDVLIAECSLPDDEAIPTHLSPTSLAAMAADAAPGRLVVTHVYPQLEALDPVARVRAAGWKGETVRAEDGRTVRIP
ncbi:MAG: ribonuclease Z [Longimicrobiales bacterium]